MSDEHRTAAPMRPILKWAGGKRQLLPAIRPYYPVRFRRYFEPFLGSGAVFLDLCNLGRLAGPEAQLSDVNTDVIGCYRMVRDAVEEVIDALLRLERDHVERGREYFYEVRDARFNPARQAILGRPDPSDAYTPELAAMLVYLNRTGYNGLFRLNARGAFNVPAGRYASVRICDAANLRRVSLALCAPGVSIALRTFEAALEETGEGDFIYLDPPYAPVSGTSSFTSYTAAGFGPEQQRALQQRVVALAERGAKVVLSNSVAPEIEALYDRNPDAWRAGLRVRTVQARRAINSRGSGRGVVLEYLISNVPPAAS
jgi:DNA adenine methylase